jgi:uncharacterized membrane protein/uncharacterized protein (UPF0548 family)
MAEWRFGRGWTAAERRERLADAEQMRRNFALDEGLAPEQGWNRHASRAVVAHEPPGTPVPGGAFHRAVALIERFAFSDPRIVRGWFDSEVALSGRRMLVEVRVLGLRYLNAVVVGATRDETNERRTVRGYRYDTLEGHIERGFEWFLVTKDHQTGEVTFTIRAAWQRGELPNLWSRIGFDLLARRYQRAWHRLAHLRLRRMLGSTGLEPLPRADRLVRDGWVPLIAASPVAAAAPPPEVMAEEREEMSRREDEVVMAMAGAFGLGIVCGARSMLAPALLSQPFAATSGPLAGDGLAARALASPRATMLLPLAAVGELVADKLPWMPSRTDPPALLGRIGSGALVGAATAAREHRTAAALAGAAGALAGTYGWYHLRRAATARGVPAWLAAVAEDALAVGLALALLQRR